MLINGIEILSAIEIRNSIIIIKKYSKNISKDIDKIDPKTLDAIAYRIHVISVNYNSISNEFKEKFVEIDWMKIWMYTMNPSYIFEEEFIGDILFDKEDGLLSDIGSFDKLFDKLFEYVCSGEFLNNEMSYHNVSEWFYSKEKYAKVCFVFLMNNIDDKNVDWWEYFPNTQKFSMKNYILSWNRFVVESKNPQITIIENEKKVTCSIGEFFISQIYFIAEESERDDLKKYAIDLYKIMKTKKSNRIQPKRVFSGSSSQELPWCNDYNDSIKTSNSIWTVRKK